MPSSSISRLSIVAAIITAVWLFPPATAASEDGSSRLVLAFYYPWYDAQSWNAGSTSDRPQTLYNSDDPAAMERHIVQAKQAGIDALVVNWWGAGNRTEKNLSAMLDVASEQDFRLSAVFDINSPLMRDVRSYTDNLAYLHRVHAAHPAYLRQRGRPVLFFYNVSRLPVATWASIRAAVDPDHQALWIAEGTDLAYLAVFDGHHLYSITWPNRVSPAETLAKWGRRVRDYARDHGVTRLWVATVMPGYDDRLIRPGSGFSRSRDGGDYYRECWRAAIASRPDWIVINSFNEWAEGTHIEPSQAYGAQYLELTAELVQRFRKPFSKPTEAPPTPPLPDPAPSQPAGASPSAGSALPHPARPPISFSVSPEPGCGLALIMDRGRWKLVSACHAGAAGRIVLCVVD